MIRLQFNSTEARDNFADRFKLNTKVDSAQLDIGWHLLQFAKLDNNCVDYDEIAVVLGTPDANSEQEFIVKGDKAKFDAYATVVQEMGNGFYLVKSTDGTLLGDHVDSIEHNSAPVTFMGNECSITDMNPLPTDIDPTSAEAQWHRIRVASKYRPLLKAYTLSDANYMSQPEVYVMDTGIDFDHPEFDYPELVKENFYTLPAFNGDYSDDVGHGTGVASMICGKNLGIATHIKLINVKIVKNGRSASFLELGAALDAILNRVLSEPGKTRIINMSWGTPRSSYLDAKIQTLLDAGVTVICAAGNNGISVEDISPAGLDTVITVGSVDRYDIPSGFNNISPTDAGITTGYGLSLDIFAPGENIVFAHPTNNDYRLGSGTSLAAPLVTGVAAIIASLNNKMVEYAALKEVVLKTATKDSLLFEDERFSDNQNNLVHLFTADLNANYKLDNISSYVGVHLDVDTITYNLNSSLNTTFYKKLFPEYQFTYSLLWEDPAIQAKYEKFFNINSVTGEFTITKPDVVLPSDVKLEMINFVGVATSPLITLKTNNMFIFHINPEFTDVTNADITLALTDVVSVSLGATWFTIK